MAEPNFFDQFDRSQPPSLQVRPADPKRPGELTIQGQSIEKNQQDIQRGNIEIGLKQRELSNQGKDLRGKDIDRETGIRKEFENLDPVKQYRTILPIYSSIIKSGDNGAGDLNIIYGLGKIMDPNSAVREGELQLAQETGSFGEQLKGYYKYVSKGGRLTSDVRNQLLSEVRSRTGAIADSYNQVRNEFKGRAGRYSMNPDDVVGIHPGAAHQQAEADFLGRPIRNLDGSQGAAPRQPQQNPLFAELEREYRAQGLEVEYDDNGKPLPVLVGGSVGKPQDDPYVTAFKSGVGDIVEGVGDVAGLLGNPLNAGINAIAGTNLSTDLGQTFRDASGLPDASDPYAAAINRGGASALTGAGIAGLLRNVVTSPVAGAVAEKVASQPIRQATAFGASGASSEGARQQGFGPGGQFLAGIAGGAAGYGGANAILGAAERAVAGPGQLAQIAQRQGVNLLPADVGGPVARRVTGAAAQAPFSATPVIQGATRAQEQIGQAASRAARREGQVLPIDEAGEAVQRAGLDYAPKQAQRIGRVYDRAQNKAKGVKIKPLQAVALLDEQIARLSQTGDMGAPMVRELQSIRDSIANGVSVSGMRDVRTLLSQGTFNGKIRSSMEKGIYKQVIKAVSSDIENGLRAAGRRDALNLFRVADRAWEQRIDHIDRVLEPVLGGGKSGEQVLEAVESMARGKSGGVKRLTGLLAEMPKDEAANVRATIVERLGKANAGQQNADGDKFSATTFLTRWNSMSDKGKAALFGGGDLRRNLDEIAKLADATAQTGKYANTSNTVGGIISNAGIIAGMGYASPKAAIISGVVQFATGRLMASPRFTAWLARVPDNPSALPRYREKLSQIAAQEPIIANDIQSVQNFLRSPQTRAAASSEEEQKNRR